VTVDHRPATDWRDVDVAMGTHVFTTWDFPV
jgi:hypothetical protein